MLCWAMMVVDRSDFEMVFATDVPGGTFTEFGIHFGGGTSFQLFNSGIGGAPLIGAAATTATWYRVALTVSSGGTAIMYVGGETGALTTYTKSGLTNPVSPTLYIGSDSFSEWWNGRVANFKHYSTVLTQIEIEAELASWTAVRTANLIRHHKFRVAETTDYSGNGNTLSGGTGTTTEADPPLTGAPVAERFAPDAILAQTGLTGVVAAIQDDPDSPDGSWLVA